MKFILLILYLSGPIEQPYTNQSDCQKAAEQKTKAGTQAFCLIMEPELY